MKHRCIDRALGPFAWGYWLMVGSDVLISQLFWFKKALDSISSSFLS